MNKSLTISDKFYQIHFVFLQNDEVHYHSTCHTSFGFLPPHVWIPFDYSSLSHCCPLNA